MEEENMNRENDEQQNIDEKNFLEDMLNKKRELAKEYRKEGHLYFVTEDRGNIIYLWDYTDKPDYEVEEFELPEETLKIAKEGTILQYINGKYELYSKRGYDELLPESKDEDKEDNDFNEEYKDEDKDQE